MRFIILILSCVLATACKPMAEGTRDATISLRDRTLDTAERLESYFVLPAYGQGTVTPPPPPDTYCYQLQMDIVCYKKPMPDGYNRLVGWHENIVPKTTHTVIKKSHEQPPQKTTTDDTKSAVLKQPKNHSLPERIINIKPLSLNEVETKDVAEDTSNRHLILYTTEEKADNIPLF